MEADTLMGICIIAIIVCIIITISMPIGIMIALNIRVPNYNGGFKDLLVGETADKVVYLMRAVSKSPNKSTITI